jgi:hypothetical protein
MMPLSQIFSIDVIFIIIQAKKIGKRLKCKKLIKMEKKQDKQLREPKSLPHIKVFTEAAASPNTMGNTKFSKSNHLDRFEAIVLRTSSSNFWTTDTRETTKRMNSKMKTMKNIKQGLKIQLIESE